ncbi:2-amino-4-hydroxy-6-hydroxymethyldihydropteridine pyrophosphokinase [Synechococcus sp. PCC 7335]|uniref:2-amino-4-hydroxy-6- hydroxymethyldihydropteridine diphosphokinase n=1 Tax=Synechococcus sp. (strain ATCC 29403 / PCC 7335) TaxID=91464 RepID=UPI00017EB0B9|nr:2-amino-4-hydroxy-6-hydroxymethyldihydropteridine diphosphokinase [Synechococcus sp. PCC 7335]EDX86559.1 2-amino-4-hydroxy-6-hydroxymethyldihydropteridine pyrophosphokinase [Synechococcus sp. PCC 7335]
MNHPSKTDSDRTSWLPAAIGLGSNLGESQKILLAAIEVIDSAVHTTVVGRSHFYKTAAIGPPQPDYINACITIETELSAQQLLSYLLAVEQQFGRVRRERWGPRSLDLDLLLYGSYGSHIINRPGLTIPHPRLHERLFVLVPLTDVAPKWQHPIVQITVEACLAKLLQQPIGQVIDQVSFEQLAG